MLVKLWQFDSADRTHVRLDFDKMESIAEAGRPGVSVTPLFRDEREIVRIERWTAGSRTTIAAAGGAEIFVIEGGFSDGTETFRPRSWLRVPIGSQAQLLAGPSGARLWIKTGHLRFARAPGI